MPRPAPPATLAPYIGRKPLKPRFWLRVVMETFGARRMERVAAARMAPERMGAAHGLENIPGGGAFILAVNHYAGRAAFDTAGAVLMAAAKIRPDLPRNIAFIVGQRHVTPKSRLRALIVRPSYAVVGWIFARWKANAVRIPLRNAEPTPAGLREWRGRDQPVFVFPEGRAGVSFGAIRRGAGRWLAALDVPVVPVGVWWTQNEGWTVVFGAKIDWTPRPDLRDVQLGLTMAALLPAALASGWQADLARWRAAHEPR